MRASAGEGVYLWDWGGAGGGDVDVGFYAEGLEEGFLAGPGIEGYYACTGYAGELDFLGVSSA